jgi:hypothetical protein
VSDEAGDDGVSCGGEEEDCGVGPGEETAETGGMEGGGGNDTGNHGASDDGRDCGVGRGDDTGEMRLEGFCGERTTAIDPLGAFV